MLTVSCSSGFKPGDLAGRWSLVNKMTVTRNVWFFLIYDHLGNCSVFFFFSSSFSISKPLKMLAANSEIEISNSDWYQTLFALFSLSVGKWNMNDWERRQIVFSGFGFIKAKVIMSINSFSYFVICCFNWASINFLKRLLLQNHRNRIMKKYS